MSRVRIPSPAPFLPKRTRARLALSGLLPFEANRPRDLVHHDRELHQGDECRPIDRLGVLCRVKRRGVAWADEVSRRRVELDRARGMRADGVERDETAVLQLQ